MSIYHVFFTPYSKEYLKHKKTFSKIIKARDSITLNILENHAAALRNIYGKSEMNESISSKLLEDYKKHYSNYTYKIKEYNKIKKNLVNDHKFRGRNSFHFWIFVFGLVSALLFFSCKSLYNDIIYGSSYGLQFLSMTGIVIACFWLIHLTVLTQKDFSENSYILLLICCSILCSIFIYFLVKNYTYKDDIILKQLSLIDRIKTIHYPRVALKALYSERNDKAMLSTDTVKHNADEFDNDVLHTLKNV